jgi:Mg-chelatase subunit ChlD
MTITRPWAFWRRIQYGIGFFVVLALISTGVYYLYLYKAPTCFDGTMNGTETGVDCGGVCQRICEASIIPPITQWAQSFKIIDGQYNAVAYVENKNKDIGTPELRYIFKIYDAEGVIVEREGKTVLPPDSIYPIFEGRVMTGTRIPTRTTIEFVGTQEWLPAEKGREQFNLEARELVNADSLPRLTAQLRNNSLDEAKDVDIVATIFDASGNPLTASQATMDFFPARTTQDVIFTWPEPIAKTLRSCDVPTDVVLAIDLSGSMDDDGKSPPEPISSVLMAAESFVNRLKTHDQIGVVTFATNALLVEKLTHEIGKVATVVKKLVISPKEQQGSTNTGDALKRTREELGSDRHSPDARKVAILLTDGLATAPKKDPEIYAQSEAVLLKDMGVQLFTIGLGEKVNETFLKTIASTEASYYKAPSVSELNGIYSSITESICEEGATVIDIVPKARTTFTRLQQP